MGGQVSLRENLFVGGVELRWPLSKVRRGHRPDDFSFFQVSHSLGTVRSKTGAIRATRLARGTTGTVSAIPPVAATAPEVHNALHLLLLSPR